MNRPASISIHPLDVSGVIVGLVGKEVERRGASVAVVDEIFVA